MLWLLATVLLCAAYGLLGWYLGRFYERDKITGDAARQDDVRRLERGSWPPAEPRSGLLCDGVIRQRSTSSPSTRSEASHTITAAARRGAEVELRSVSGPTAGAGPAVSLFSRRRRRRLIWISPGGSC